MKTYQDLLPPWCYEMKLSWLQLNYVQQLQSLSKAVARVTNASLILAAWQTTNTQMKSKVLNIFQKDPILKQHPEIAEGTISDSLVKQLLAVSKVPDDKQNEILFFIIQPLDILIKRTAQLGPDGVGFYEHNGQRIACCISISYYEDYNQEKRHSNLAKLDPANFYTYYTKHETNNVILSEQDGIKLVQYPFAKYLQLPQKFFGISITIPTDFEGLSRIYVKERSCIMEIDNDVLRALDEGLAKLYLDIIKQ
jgi:hypothetical protein